VGRPPVRSRPPGRLFFLRIHLYWRTMVRGLLPPPTPSPRRNRTTSLPHLASARQSPAASILPGRHPQFRTGICRHGPTPRPSSRWSFLLSPARVGRHCRGGHPLQWHCVGALLCKRVCGHAQSRSLVGGARCGSVQADQVAKGHHGQAGKRDAGTDGKPVLARGELRSSGSPRTRRYFEENPVHAGLATAAGEYRWSSAGWAIGGSPANPGVRPTMGPQPLVR